MYVNEDNGLISEVLVITPENEPYTKGDRLFDYMGDELTNPAIMLKTDW
jgi:hypothetical protein